MATIKKAFEDITKEEFGAYEKVRASGRWNMWDNRAMNATGLDDETYDGIIRNYSALADKWPDVRKAPRRKEGEAFRGQLT